MHKTVEGIIIREVSFGESDKYLTLLTDSLGKIEVLAKGIRRKNSRQAAFAHLFAYGRFTLFENKGHYSLNDGEVIHGFFEITEEIERYALACYLADITAQLAEGHLDGGEFLAFFVRALYSISLQHRDIHIVKAAFELKALCLAGFSPRITSCGLCGGSEKLRAPVFVLGGGMLCCYDCFLKRYPMKENKVKLTEDVVKVMLYIMNAPPKRLFAFSVGGETRETLFLLCEEYLLAQTGRSYKTLDFLKSVTTGGTK